MNTKLAFAGIAVAAMAVLAGCTGGVGGGGISGKVSRAGGGSAGGATVVACLVDDDCDTYSEAKAGSDGSYTVGKLGDGKGYVVLGLLDTNKDGEADYLGWYESVEEDPTVVKAPKSGVNFQLYELGQAKQQLKVLPKFLR
ncbi:hypothetical protein Mterra_02238 [Calidithermus terrae]|uniref:Lipoprotein n=1 Tax=Calidithermus terrae TaxID=1408545 RepID=A0A399EN55_9DEIN|nr:hypothetical protein [Calidithermus terrae]RIH83581.1 hypothetical protein Mterra_02238 [Calidithermus terrae]